LIPDKIAVDIARDIPLGEGRENLQLNKTGLEAVINKGVAAVPALAQRSGHRAWEAFDPDSSQMTCKESRNTATCPPTRARYQETRSKKALISSAHSEAETTLLKSSTSRKFLSRI